jgi:DNA-binding response OmpR family regulator
MTTTESTAALLITQDDGWSLSLHRHLWRNGFAPLSIARNRETALDLFRKTTPRLVLIDLCQPDCNVVDLCADMLRAQPAIKIVLIGDNQAEAPLAAIHAGVSGCIERSVPLLAWQGLLVYILSGGVAFSRNVADSMLAQEWPAAKTQPLVTIGPLRIDLSQRQTRFAEQDIELTPREFALLTCLARYTDRVVTFDQLLSEAWGYDESDGTPAQVRLYVARLRRKLKENAQVPEFILTERGVGYRLNSGVLHKTGERGTYYEARAAALSPA